MSTAPGAGRTPPAQRPLLPLGIAVVRGASMEPTLQAGDRLLVRYGAAVRPGHVVVARFADGVVVVKRAERRTHDGWWVRSDNVDAEGVLDSRHRGAVPDDRVLGVALVRVWPRPRRL